MPRGAADLEGDFPGAVVIGERRRQGVELEAGGADGEVAEPGEVVDLDGEGGGFMIEEIPVDVEEHLVIPHGIGVAFVVDLGGELVIGGDVGDGERSEHFGDRGEVLGGDEVDFEELGRRHGWLVACGGSRSRRRRRLP